MRTLLIASAVALFATVPCALESTVQPQDPARPGVMWRVRPMHGDRLFVETWDSAGDLTTEILFVEDGGAIAADALAGCSQSFLRTMVWRQWTQKDGTVVWSETSVTTYRNCFDGFPENPIAWNNRHVQEVNDALASGAVLVPPAQGSTADYGEDAGSLPAQTSVNQRGAINEL